MPADKSPRRIELGQAAVSVFARKGYAAATVQDIADIAGIRKGSVYKHIDNKEDLLFDLLEIAHEQTVALMETIDDLAATPLERVHEYLRRYVLWYLDNVDLLHVFFQEWDALTTPERREVVRERRRLYDRFMRELVAECQTAGEADPSINAQYASFYMLAGINATPEWYPRAPAGPSPEQVARDTADLAVGMLRFAA